MVPLMKFITNLQYSGSIGPYGKIFQALQWILRGPLDQSSALSNATLTSHLNVALLSVYKLLYAP